MVTKINKTTYKYLLGTKKKRRRGNKQVCVMKGNRLPNKATLDKYWGLHLQL